jgi:transglutaminase-like putative cysteine protease
MAVRVSRGGGSVSMPAPGGAAGMATFDQLLWVTVCLGLALLPGMAALPVWVSVTVAAAAAIRLGLAARGRDAPPRAVRLGITGLAIGLLFLEFHTFNGLAAGTALLSLIAGLKLLETRTHRDLQVIVLIIYFLSLATLLEGESFWLLGFLVAVCWVTTSTLLRLSVSARRGNWRGNLRHAGRLLAQALPVAAACWLFFPRFGGPLWQLPDSGGGATTGLSDTMSPGDITDLAKSDEVAFRVRFSAAAPPAAERYWRGPVLHVFDGHTWSRTDPGPVPAPTLSFRGPAYRYTVSLEPSPHNWLYVLDWPSQWDAPRAHLTNDYMLVQAGAVSQPIDVTATSYGDVQAVDTLSAAMRRLDTQFPGGRNPRTLRLARELRHAHPDDREYLGAVLDMFHRQPFYYTLTPPRLAADSVDGFLFDSKRGFCGHYASALATLARAAGIPARVVTGYQGGTYNRFADYWILRQSDAHAWTEVWIDGRGWLRVDPTAAVAPERVEHGLNDLVTAGAPLASRWQQRTPWPWLTDTRLRLDALRLLWRERILRFDANSQERLLDWLHVPDPDGEKLALILAICLIAGMSWLTWQVRRDPAVGPTDPVDRAYRRLCRRLAAAGLPRLPHEGAEAFAARVAAARPELGGAVGALCRRYSTLKYAAAAPQPAAAAFIAAVRAFRPGRDE